MSDKTGKIAILGLLSALALALSIVEASIPTSGLLPPGVKLGLSNIVTMFTAFFMGFSGAGVIVLIKGIFAFVTRGAVAGLLSFSGGILSAFAICLMFKIKKNPFSFTGISILGAVCHNIAQIAVISLITLSPAYMYLPVLIISAVITGMLNGILLKGVFPYMKRIFHRKEEKSRGTK